MSMHALIVRFATAALFAMVAAVAVAQRQPAATQPAVAQKSTPAAIVTLPTVRVRPTAAEVAEAMHADDAPIGTATPPSRMQPVSASLPVLGLDMPYYSFGKVLPRVSQRIQQ